MNLRQQRMQCTRVMRVAADERAPGRLGRQRQVHCTSAQVVSAAQRRSPHAAGPRAPGSHPTRRWHRLRRGARRARGGGGAGRPQPPRSASRPRSDIDTARTTPPQRQSRPDRAAEHSCAPRRPSQLRSTHAPRLHHDRFAARPDCTSAPHDQLTPLAPARHRPQEDAVVRVVRPLRTTSLLANRAPSPRCNKTKNDGRESSSLMIPAQTGIAPPCLDATGHSATGAVRMIPRRKHNASSGSLPAPDDKHASNDYILSDSAPRERVCAALRRRFNRKTLHKRVPITAWLPQYNMEKAVGDLIAGVTVGLTVIPQSLAYSNIAGLPPQHGLYGSFLGCFVYIVLGGCRAVPAGPTAIASLLTWQVAGGVVEKAVLLTLLAGVVKLLMGVLGLGFLINFVSGPVSSGFTSAVALMIATSQVKDLFAIEVTGTTFLQQWISIFRNLHGASLWDPVLGFVCIALLLLMRKIGMTKLGAKSESGPNTRQKVLTKCMWLLGTCRNAIVVVATGVLGFWLVSTYGQSPVRLMGAIPSGVPMPQLPPFSYVRADNTTADFLDMVSELGSGLLVIPLIVLLEDIAICKAFSDGRTIDATQEMIALGVAGIANSFMQAYPGGGSLARSVVSNGSGVKTTFNGFYTGVMVILALQFFTQYFEFIPKAALAAVIISAILFMVEYNVIKPMWRAKKLDLIPGVGTFVLCLTLPIELGILTGVIVNIIFILYHAARPKFSVEMLKTEAGVEYLMITPDRCLMFPSVDYVRRLVTKFAASGSVPVVLECTHIYSADYTAAKSIEQLTADFHARRQPLYFYNVKPSVCSIFEAVAKPEHFVVFYEDEELDRLLAADERLAPTKQPPPPHHA